MDFYNLDVIISIGYRVKSLRGTQFRIWATSILKEYMKKGFALDDDRLKNLGGGNYFDELLARIRDIRLLKKYFGEKYWKYMQPALITTQRQRVPLSPVECHFLESIEKLHELEEKK